MTNDRWKPMNIVDAIKEVASKLRSATVGPVKPTAVILRVPEGIEDVKLFEPIQDGHPLLVEHGLTGTWYPVAMYGSRGADDYGYDEFGPVCDRHRNFKSHLSSVKETCYRITLYPQMYERGDILGRKAVDIYVPGNRNEYFGLDLSDVVKGVEDA